MQNSINAIGETVDAAGNGPDRRRAAKDRYYVALDAALLILEELDTLPPSNAPVRLAKVIGVVLDATYEVERHPEGHHDS